MEAGRELDALIAEKVMGLPKCDVWLEPNYSGPNFWVPQTAGHLKYYSTDMNAAWESVEKVKELSAFEGKFDQYREPWITFCSSIAGFEDYFSCAFTKVNPHSICLAALKGIEWLEKYEARKLARRHTGIDVTEVP